MLVEERKVKPDELAAADEIFLTSSIMEVIPVTVLDGRPVGDRPVPGAITLQLARLYKELAEKG
jgi:branched-subunit amino acid aminotransferase/4-amino-4-deoxychorismate lyase